jgi:ATP-binding cassette subfamily B protein
MPGEHVEPKDRSTVQTLLRLWPYVKPVRKRLFGAALVAIVASSAGLVIPLVLKWIVDGPVADRDPGGVWLGALYLLLLGIGEAGLFGVRRWLVARPLAGVEAAMRADLYRHLQRLPVAFHDRWASGQLLSRATTDLMLLRQFLAFPLTFLLVNGATILIGFVILLMQQWTLGLVLLAPAVPMMIICWVFETKFSTVARRAQDQVGDLTTVVEESVLGIRVIKGFGRHRSQALAFRSLSDGCAPRSWPRPVSWRASGPPSPCSRSWPSVRRWCSERSRSRTATSPRAPWSPFSPPRSRCAGRWSRSASCWR